MAQDRVIRVVLADDHVVFRMGLRQLLTRGRQVQVVSEAETGERAIEEARRCRPDVVVMDAGIAAADSLALVRRIKAELPDTQVIVLGGTADEDKVMGALLAGANGCLSKDDDPSAIRRAVLQGSTGKLYLGPDIAKDVMARVSQRQPEARRREIASDLSAREMAILRHMILGKNNREIARLLGVTERTVGNSISRLLIKLRVENRTQAIVSAVRRGLVKL